MDLGGWWDYPNSTEIGSFVSRSGKLPLVGWVVGKNPRVTVLVDSREVVTFPPVLYREDIAICFYHASGGAAGLNAWSHAIDVTGFEPGEHDVGIIVRDDTHPPQSLGVRRVDFTVSPP